MYFCSRSLVEVPFLSGAEVEDLYIKRRTCALCLTYWNLAVSNWLLKAKQQRRPFGVYSWHFSRESLLALCFVVVYILLRGLRRCSSQQSGRCQSLNTWDERQLTLTHFLYIWTNRFFVCRGRGSLGATVLVVWQLFIMIPLILICWKSDSSVKSMIRRLRLFVLHLL